VVLDQHQTVAVNWAQFRDSEGVQGKLFWEDFRTHSAAGLMHLNPGASVSPHSHRRNVHHLWIVSGSCRLDGKDVGAGSYQFVPAGVEHGIEAAGRRGCTIFYLYLGCE
jgi:mannose-6-phosphate isomerase-like protein (cupin superfamily)